MADGGGERYNLKNPGVKRILQEVKELQSNPSDDYMSMPLEDNIFEWQFAIRGPKDSEFEGGIYHGRIQLPPEYPFKPPAFMLLTPNGRFETQTKICLSISAHHPEHWQPSWSVRTALVALIAFMPTKPEGALGSLDYSKEERRALAIKSREAAPKFGNAERQKVIDEIHVQMLQKAHPVPLDVNVAAATDGEETKVESMSSGAEAKAKPVEEEIARATFETITPLAPPPPSPAPSPSPSPSPSPVPPPCSAAAAAAAAAASQHVESGRLERRGATRQRQGQQQSSGDYGLTLLAIGLAVAIVGILLKKVLRFYGYVVDV